jgi:copper chaperone CopZ
VLREETLQVSGVRCERCVMRLAKVLEGHEGLESANANLMGVVSLAWDDERTSREALLEALQRGGFHEASSGASARSGFPDAG